MALAYVMAQQSGKAVACATMPDMTDYAKILED